MNTVLRFTEVCVCTLHQVFVVYGGQVGQVLLQVRAELSVRVDLDQLFLTSGLFSVKIRHVLLGFGADLGTAAAYVIGAQHVLYHVTAERESVC